ncbi:uroporphyrinogen-III C-methyltransferase [Inquilinus sp. CAU 1745]|uniref:uroporphyrinogen-III C-methyltransferase n=1 Tax=Inquilinus sp. CAU 1745 TaxID=3140369 RepID=UPI00325BDD96
MASPATPGGRVILVGAGPGDPDLLTLKAVKAMRAADIILHDDLVSPEVLDMAGPTPRRVPVGKRGGRPGCPQQEINALMVTLALSGKRIVRLKSGDPMIFGRAGEEIACLVAAGIAVEIVPGITSALAMASALGLSLTHRDRAQSVRFVTGHARTGGLPEDLDWRSVADPGTTTIFYMGGRYAARIARRLIDEGLPPGTPVAAMASVSRADETAWRGCLVGLAAEGLPLPAGAPVLMAIGGAVENQQCPSPSRFAGPSLSHKGRG